MPAGHHYAFQTHLTNQTGTAFAVGSISHEKDVMLRGHLPVATRVSAAVDAVVQQQGVLLLLCTYACLIRSTFAHCAQQAQLLLLHVVSMFIAQQ
eukprot:12865-Heterococcus_DN1.PRE.1